MREFLDRVDCDPEFFIVVLCSIVLVSAAMRRR